MRVKNRASGKKSDAKIEEPKKQKPSNFMERLVELKVEALDAEMARRKAVSDAKAKVQEDEVARMTYGPSYDEPYEPEA